METSSFFVEYQNKNNVTVIEIKPWQNDVIIWYYYVLINNSYQFTISPSFQPNRKNIQWKISLKNADNDVDSKLIEMIGREVERRVLLPN